jgi:hypothetical protein
MVEVGCRRGCDKHNGLSSVACRQRWLRNHVEEGLCSSVWWDQGSGLTGNGDWLQGLKMGEWETEQSGAFTSWVAGRRQMGAIGTRQFEVNWLLQYSCGKRPTSWQVTAMQNLYCITLAVQCVGCVCSTVNDDEFVCWFLSHYSVTCVCIYHYAGCAWTASWQSHSTSLRIDWIMIESMSWMSTQLECLIWIWHGLLEWKGRILMRLKCLMKCL